MHRSPLLVFRILDLQQSYVALYLVTYALTVWGTDCANKQGFDALETILWRATILGDPGAVSRDGRKGAAKLFKHRWKSPWVPTLTGPFPKGQANAGSWLGTQNVLCYCAQSANSFSWVLFVSSYTTAIDSITACLAHAPKKCTQSGNFQFDINSPVQNTVYPKTKDAFPKIQAWAYNKCLLLHRSRLLKYSGV